MGGELKLHDSPERKKRNFSRILYEPTSLNKPNVESLDAPPLKSSFYQGYCLRVQVEQGFIQQICLYDF